MTTGPHGGGLLGGGGGLLGGGGMMGILVVDLVEVGVIELRVDNSITELLNTEVEIVDNVETVVPAILVGSEIAVPDPNVGMMDWIDDRDGVTVFSVDKRKEVLEPKFGLTD